MPRRNTDYEEDRVWAMSDRELVRSGTKLIGRVLCGNTKPKAVVSRFRHSRSFTHPSGSWAVFYCSEPNQELCPAEGFQPTDHIPRREDEAVTIRYNAYNDRYTWINPIPTTSNVTTAQNLTMAQAQYAYEILNNSQYFYYGPQQMQRQVEEIRGQAARAQRESLQARHAQSRMDRYALWSV